MKISSRKGIASVLLTASIFSMLGTASAATSTKTVVGIPINTFCSTYAKDLATKSVGIGLVVKIKDNPSLKSALMKQYATFLSLGKINCKNQYAPSVYGFTPSTTTATTPVTQPSTSTDISKNTPIIITKTAHFNGPEDYFTGYDTTLLTTLNSQQMDVVQQRIAKAKVEYAEIVEDLIQQGWLKSVDKNEMVGKITFKFSDNCNQLDGKILVRQRFDQYNNPTKTELLNLFITINLCFNNSYENNYETFLDRIIYHELGHYFNYFYDKNDDEFISICWNGSQNICQSGDFISAYAPTSPDEDYAETFSYYLQDNKPVQGAKLQQKIDYFKIRDPRY